MLKEIKENTERSSTSFGARRQALPEPGPRVMQNQFSRAPTAKQHGPSSMIVIPFSKVYLDSIEQHSQA